MKSHTPFCLRRRSFWQALLLAGMASRASADAPGLMLANAYRPGQRGMDWANWWVSEKYDGVRGYWNGQQLMTRGGEPVRAPAWFTAGWPALPLDGELWAGHGQFAEAVSTARRQSPDDQAWRRMAFMVFDLPAASGSFDARLATLPALVAGVNAPWLRAVAQRRLPSEAALMAEMQRTVRAGGEGLVLHRGGAPYAPGRTGDLVKVKPFADDEAQVLAHLAGQGRLTGAMGALLVQTEAGVRFKLGTGFSAAQRLAPPPVGAWVTFRFRDLNPGGVPRFASFLRLREDHAGASTVR
ncbi:MAG: ligase [Rhodoferax sp.]|nr:ligase [Rhodoferax sp.]